MKMLEKNNKKISIRKQCDLLSIPRSSVYYEHLTPEWSEHTIANEIHDLWNSNPVYGYRKITALLRRAGYRINRKKVLRIMREMHLQAIYQKPKTSISNPENKIYPYLLRNLGVIRCNQAWSIDITYLKVRGGFVYLTAVIDIFSRHVMGHAVSNTMDTRFCLQALEMALGSGHKPEIINTDQGCQFTSKEWIDFLKKQEIEISMDGKGRWADNIYIERFWRTIKYEHIFLHEFDSVSLLRRSIIDFIDIYNNKRPHQSLNYQTPAEVYAILNYAA